MKLAVALASCTLFGCAPGVTRIDYGYMLLGHWGPVQKKTFTVDADCRITLEELRRLPRSSEARRDDCARLFAVARRQHGDDPASCPVSQTVISGLVVERADGRKARFCTFRSSEMTSAVSQFMSRYEDELRQHGRTPEGLCEPSECQQADDSPRAMCSDLRTTPGPTGRCLRRADGSCTPEVLTCPNSERNDHG